MTRDDGNGVQVLFNVELYFSYSLTRRVIWLNNAPSSALLGGGYHWVGEELGAGVEGTSQSIKNCWVRIWWKGLEFPVGPMWNEWPLYTYGEWLFSGLKTAPRTMDREAKHGGKKDRKTSSDGKCQLKVIRVHCWTVMTFYCCAVLHKITTNAFFQLAIRDVADWWWGEEGKICMWISCCQQHIILSLMPSSLPLFSHYLINVSAPSHVLQH